MWSLTDSISATHDNKRMCKLICVLIAPATPMSGVVLRTLLCWFALSVWGLLSFIALILYLRWHVDQSSARDEPIAKLPHAEAPALAEQGTLPAVGPLRSLTDGPEGSSLHAA